MGYTAEENPEIRRLALFVQAHEFGAVVGRISRAAGWHRGPCGVQQTGNGPLARRTVVQVRDAGRRRRQYLTVLDIDRLELKDGARFRPARDVLAESKVMSAEEIIARHDAKAGPT